MTIPIKLVPTTGTAAELREFAASDKMEIGNLPVVGIVADTGGVPSGAIIESGNTGNDYYIRYAEGTQICYGSAAAVDTTSLASGGLFASPTQTDFVFAKPFIAPPTGGLTVRKTAATTGATWPIIAGGAVMPSNTGISGRQLGTTSASQGILGYHVIGRWK